MPREIDFQKLLRLKRNEPRPSLYLLWLSGAIPTDEDDALSPPDSERPAADWFDGLDEEEREALFGCQLPESEIESLYEDLSGEGKALVFQKWEKSRGF